MKTIKIIVSTVAAIVIVALVLLYRFLIYIVESNALTVLGLCLRWLPVVFIIATLNYFLLTTKSE